MRKLIVVVVLGLFLSAAYAQKPMSDVRLIRSYLPDGGERVYMVIDSVMHGLCIYYDSLGRRKIESCYVNGEQTGPSILYYTNGNIAQEGYFINGKCNGKAVSYYQDGKIKRISNCKMGLRDGIEETYIEDGRLDKRLLYRNDTLIYILEDHHYLPLPPTVKPLYN